MRKRTRYPNPDGGKGVTITWLVTSVTPQSRDERSDKVTYGQCLPVTADLSTRQRWWEAPVPGWAKGPLEFHKIARDAAACINLRDRVSRGGQGRASDFPRRFSGEAVSEMRFRDPERIFPRMKNPGSSAASRRRSRPRRRTAGRHCPSDEIHGRDRISEPYTRGLFATLFSQIGEIAQEEKMQ